jgi:hypothetical protein
MKTGKSKKSGNTASTFSELLPEWLFGSGGILIGVSF